jgi:hypothetical protein
MYFSTDAFCFIILNVQRDNYQRFFVATYGTISVTLPKCVFNIMKFYESVYLLLFRSRILVSSSYNATFRLSVSGYKRKLRPGQVKQCLFCSSRRSRQ